MPTIAEVALHDIDWDWAREEFHEWNHQRQAYDEPAIPDDAVMLLGWEEGGGYESSVDIVYWSQGNLWQVEASHCSCNSYEGEWSPGRTTIGALTSYKWSVFYNDADRCRWFAILAGMLEAEAVETGLLALHDRLGIATVATLDGT